MRVDGFVRALPVSGRRYSRWGVSYLNGRMRGTSLEFDTLAAIVGQILPLPLDGNRRESLLGWAKSHKGTC